MTGNFEYFVFSVFKTDSLLLQDIKKRIADLYQESFALGKAVFISDAFSITRYYNPSVSGSKDDIFSTFESKLGRTLLIVKILHSLYPTLPMVDIHYVIG